MNVPPNLPNKHFLRKYSIPLEIEIEQNNFKDSFKGING